MKLLAPIARIEELETLAASGAEELYTGFVPPEWLERMTGAVWLSRRAPKGTGAVSRETFRSLLDAAHGRGLPLFVTLNAPSYAASQETMVLDLAREIRDMGGDAVIVADPAMVFSLREEIPDLAVHVSSVAATLNGESIRFWREAGVRRVILPRSVTLAEIGGLAAAAGGLELEVFLLNDGCAFEEGFCHTTHHHSVGAFCSDLAGMEAEIVGPSGPLPGGARDRLAENRAAYLDWISHQNGCGGEPSAKGLPLGACGLCAVPELRALGVASLKVVGREANPMRKFLSVRMARAVLGRERRGDAPRSVRRFARELRGEPAICDSRVMCYYRIPSP